MAGPITWRTVGGGGGNPAALLAMGTNSVQQGLQALQDLATRQQRQALSSFESQRERNTQDYLDQVASITSAADLANPETQAQLDAVRLGYGNMIDRAAARAAVPQALANLQRQETAAAQFQDMTTEREQRPLVEQLYSLARSGDTAGAQRLLDETNFLNEGRLGADVDNIFRSQRQEQRQTRQDQRAEAQFRESMASAAENRVLRREQLQDMRENRQIRRGVQAIDGAAAEVEQRIQLLQATNPIGQKSTNVQKDAAVLLESLGSSNDPWFGLNDTARAETSQGIQKLLTDGVTIGTGEDARKVAVSPAIIQQAISVMKDNFRGLNGPLPEMENYIRALFTNNPELAERAIATEDAIADLRATQRNLGQQRRTLLSGGIDLDSLSGTLPRTTPGRVIQMLPERDEDQ